MRVRLPSGWNRWLVMMGLVAGLLGMPPLVQAQQGDKAADIAFWNSVKDSKSAAEVQAYLDAFPNGTFAPLARIRLKSLQGGGGAAPLAGPAPTGAAPAVAPRQAFSFYDPAIVREVQTKLYNLNYSVRSFNGVLNNETKEAVRAWQEKIKLPATGVMDEGQMQRLRAAVVPSTWGALAYSVKGASAAVWRAKSRQEAESKALADCRKRTKDPCRIVTAANTTCGALSFYQSRIGSKVHYGAYAFVRPTLSLATNAALDKCRSAPKSNNNCGIRIMFCADGSHKR